MAWSDKNDYQKYTYANLIMNGELFGISYNDAKDIKMSGLIFYPTGASNEIINSAAQMMSERLDLRFSNDGNAEYETGISPETARIKIAESLKEAENTIETLAETINTLFKFTDEAGE